MARTKQTARKSTGYGIPHQTEQDPINAIKGPGSIEPLTSDLIKMETPVPTPKQAKAKLLGNSISSAQEALEIILPLSINEQREVLAHVPYFTLLKFVDDESVREAFPFINRNFLVHSTKRQEDQPRALFAQAPSSSELQDPHVGLIDIYTHQSEFVARNLSDEEAQWPIIFPQVASVPGVSVIASRSEFDDNWSAFTCDLFRDMDWNNVFAAGGSVLAALTPITRTMVDTIPKNGRGYKIRLATAATDTNAPGVSDAPKPVKLSERRSYFLQPEFGTSDVDLFIYGLTEDEANRKLDHIFQTIRGNCTIGQVMMFRSQSAITIMSGYPFRNVQVIARLYQSPAEVLMGFDLDACTYGYDGKNVWTLPRGHRALCMKYQIVDLSRRSPSYEFRLSKYSNRGFSVVIPGFDRQRLDTNILKKMPHEVKGLARLLRLTNTDDIQTMFPDKRNHRQMWPYRSKYSYLEMKNFQEKVALYEIETEKSVSDYTSVLIPWGTKWTPFALTSVMTYKYWARAFLANGGWNADVVLPVPDCVIADNVADVIAGNTDVYQYKLADVHRLTARFHELKRPVDIIPLNFRTVPHPPMCEPLRWLTVNPGTQFVGSFHPSDDDWEEGVFVDNRIKYLMQACARGDVEQLTKYIASGVPLNRCDPVGRYPLHIAATLPSTECAKALLVAGSPSTVVNMRGHTPIVVAVQLRNIPLVKLFAEADPSTLRTESLEQSPLYAACSLGYLDVAKVLVACGADPTRAPGPSTSISTFPSARATPSVLSMVRRALAQGFVDMADWLLEIKAWEPTLEKGVTDSSIFPNQYNRNLATFLLDLNVCCVDSLRVLVKHGLLSSSAKEIDTIFASSLTHKNRELYKYLIEAGVVPPVEQCHKLWTEVLQQAPDAIDSLIGMGVNVNAVDASVRIYPLEIVDERIGFLQRRILDAQVLKFAKPVSGMDPDEHPELIPPPFASPVFGDITKVSAFLPLIADEINQDSITADISLKGLEDFTPIIRPENTPFWSHLVPAYESALRARSSLLAAGAKRGKNRSVQPGSDSVCAYEFRKRMLELFSHIAKGNLQEVQLVIASMLASGWSIDSTLSDDTALTVAVKTRQTEIVRYLVDEKNADISRKFRFVSPIWLTIALGNAELYQYFLKLGGSSFSTEWEGKWNALIFASAFDSPLLKDVIFMNASAVDRNTGATPLHLACLFGSPNAVRLLLPTHDPSLRTRNGHNAFDLAAAVGNLEVLDLCVQHMQKSIELKWKHDNMLATVEYHRRRLDKTATEEQPVLAMPIFVPSYSTVLMAAGGNHIHVLEYLFKLKAPFSLGSDPVEEEVSSFGGPRFPKFGRMNSDEWRKSESVYAAAVSLGSLEAARWLLDHGFPISSSEQTSLALMQLSCMRSSSSDMIHFLIDNRVHHLIELKLWGILYGYALQSNNMSAITTLRECGIPVTAPIRSINALYMMCRTAPVEAVRNMLVDVDVSSLQTLRTAMNETSTHAAFAGRKGTLALLHSLNLTDWHTESFSGEIPVEVLTRQSLGEEDRRAFKPSGFPSSSVGNTDRSSHLAFASQHREVYSMQRITEEWDDVAKALSTGPSAEVTADIERWEQIPDPTVFDITYLWE